MNLNDLKILSNLIKTYGVVNIENFLEANKLFIEYMNEPEHSYSKIKTVDSLYAERDLRDDKRQMFTNGETSVFCLNEKTLDFTILDTDGNMYPPSKLSSVNKIEEYVEQAKTLLGDSIIPVSLILSNGVVLVEGYGGVSAINVNETKLAELLLKSPKMYVSRINPVLYAESDKGYAYILGKKFGIQETF